MDLKKVFELIEKEIKEAEIIAKAKNKEIEFFDDVIRTNTFSNLQGLLSLDYQKVMASYLCAISNELGIDKIYNLIKKNDILTDPEDENFKELVFRFLKISKEGNKGFIQRKLINNIENMIKKQKIERFDLEATKELYETYNEEFIKILSLITCIKEIKNEYISKSDRFDDFKNIMKGIRVSDKKKDEFIKEWLEEIYKVDKIYKDLSIITNYYDSIRAKEKNTKKRARKTITNYTTLIKHLKSLTPNSILNKPLITNILSLIDDEDILKEFLYQVNIEQKKYFDELNNEYLNLSQDNKINIQSILKKYEIDFNKLPTNLKNKLLKLDKEDLEEFLKSIKELGITNSDLICFTLENSTIEIIKNIIILIKDGAITLDFILKNKEFLSINTPNNNYNSLIEKIQLFKNEGINYRLFINELDIYLVDFPKISYNIKVLKQYNLLFGLNKLNSFKLLKEDFLENKIDLYLELGYEKILEENIQLLNIDITKIKKLYILKYMGLLPTDIDSLINIIDNKNFLDYIDDIDNYIFNIVNYRIDNNLIKDNELDLNKYFSFNNNNRVIEINGVLLSSNRIRRNTLKLENVNLSDHDKTLYSLVYGSILTEEEYNIVISNLTDINKKIH